MAAALDYQYLSTLVERAQQDDSNAFAELYAATYQKEYWFAFNYLKDEYLAQDALQETYILVLKNIIKLKDPMLFVSWLNQICFRVCFNMHKKQREVQRRSVEYSETSLHGDEITMSDNSLESQIVNIDQQEYIVRQILNLPFTESQVIILRYYHSMKIEDIAKLMEISRSTVKRYLESARGRLKQSLS